MLCFLLVAILLQSKECEVVHNHTEYLSFEISLCQANAENKGKCCIVEMSPAPWTTKCYCL